MEGTTVPRVEDRATRAVKGRKWGDLKSSPEACTEEHANLWGREAGTVAGKRKIIQDRERLFQRWAGSSSRRR